MKGNIFLDTDIKMWVDICCITHKEVLAAETLGKDFKRRAQNPDGQRLSQGRLLTDIWMRIFVTGDSSQSPVHYPRIRVTSRKLFSLDINKREITYTQTHFTGLEPFFSTLFLIPWKYHSQDIFRTLASVLFFPLYIFKRRWYVKSILSQRGLRYLEFNPRSIIDLFHNLKQCLKISWASDLHLLNKRLTNYFKCFLKFSYNFISNFCCEVWVWKISIILIYCRRKKQGCIHLYL